MVSPLAVTRCVRFAAFVAAAATVAAVAVAAAAAWPGPPRAAPPPHRAAPAPAWFETPTRSTWLAYGSYCWRTVCADMPPPQSRRNLPRITLAPRQLVRIHLGFAPRDAHLTRFAGTHLSHVRLKTARTLLWRVDAGGVISIDVRGRFGSASYLARITVD